MKNRLVHCLLAIALVSPTAAFAGGPGFATQLSQAVTITGETVPEVVVIVDAGRRSLDRAPLERSLRAVLARQGVQPTTVEVQSVATAAMEFAAGQDRGVQTNCYETWCARVFLAGN